jgi:hypothetical protein
VALTKVLAPTVVLPSSVSMFIVIAQRAAFEFAVSIVGKKIKAKTVETV